MRQSTSSRPHHSCHLGTRTRQQTTSIARRTRSIARATSGAITQRPHDRDRCHSPSEHFHLGLVEHLMIPTDTRSEPAVPGSAPAVDAGTPLLPPAAGDTSYHRSIYFPWPPPTSRSRLTGAPPRTGIGSPLRPTAALNPHRPPPSIRGFVQPGCCATPRAAALDPSCP